MDRTVTITLQDAYRLVSLIDAGSFPVSAMRDGNYAAFETFKATVFGKIDNGGSNDVSSKE